MVIHSVPIWMTVVTGFCVLFGIYGIWRHKHPPTEFTLPPLVGFWIIAIAYGLILIACVLSYLFEGVKL